MYKFALGNKYAVGTVNHNDTTKGISGNRISKQAPPDITIYPMPKIAGNS